MRIIILDVNLKQKHCRNTYRDKRNVQENFHTVDLISEDALSLWIFKLSSASTAVNWKKIALDRIHHMNASE